MLINHDTVHVTVCVTCCSVLQFSTSSLGDEIARNRDEISAVFYATEKDTIIINHTLKTIYAF